MTTGGAREAARGAHLRQRVHQRGQAGREQTESERVEGGRKRLSVSHLGNQRLDTTRVTIPIGTLIEKIQR